MDQRGPWIIVATTFGQTREKNFEFESAPREHPEMEFAARTNFFRRERALAVARFAPSTLAASMFARTGILAANGATPPIDVLPLGLLESLKPAPRASVPEGRLRRVFFGNVAPVNSAYAPS